MTEPSEAAKRPSRAALQRARDLSNATTEQWFEGVLLPPPLLAFARYIARVSDLAAYVSQYVDNGAAPPEALRQQLHELILPAEPDPVLEGLALALAGVVPEIDRRYGEGLNEAVARQLLAELAKHGKSLKIVEAGRR